MLVALTLSNNGVLSHPHNKKMFSDVLMEPSVFLFVSTACDPISGHHREVPGSVFTPFLWVFLCSDEMPPSLPFYRLNSQSQLSQPFLTGELPQPLNHFCVFHWALQYVRISLVLGNTEYLDILKLYNNLF